MPGPDDLDRSRFLRMPEFWGMYYYMDLGTEDADSPEWMEPLFGVSDKAVNSLSATSFTIDDDPPWPYVHLPFAGRWALNIFFGDGGECFYLHHPSNPALLRLGETGATPMLPIFRWAEIEQISKALESREKSELSPEAALLLLFPATCLTADDDRAKVNQALSAAWRALKVARPEGIPTLVERSMDAMSCSIHWRQDPVLGWVNDSQYSHRNPRRAVKPWSPRQFAFVRAFFDCQTADIRQV